MDLSLSEQQIRDLKQRLLERLAELREDVRQELIASDNEQYIRFSSGVNDPGDNSVADLLADLDLAIIHHHISEIREVEAALMRIAKGTYGYCVEDEEPIEYNRLKANPIAQRCYLCQRRYEESYAQPGHATL